MLVLTSLFSVKAVAQVLPPAYPVPAEDITRNLSATKLTVKVGFSSACTGIAVTVALPTDVNYVPGSLTLDNSNIGGATITESNISNLRKPVFTISDITDPGDLTFTIRRKVGCGTSASGKDTVSIVSNCGSVVENDGNVNSYNIISPVLTITPPVAITNAFVGNAATRQVVLTNGGNGCVDTIRYYVVYPAGGIQNTMTGNAVTANGIDFTPYRSNGDTLFYKFSGTIFGADQLMCNGETITIDEHVRIVKCNTTSTYATEWGSAGASCQKAIATSAVVMTSGVPSITATVSRIKAMNWCRPGVFTITYTNTSTSGGKAAAAYSMHARIGYNTTGNTTNPGGTSVRIVGRIDSVTINNVVVPFTAPTASAPGRANFTSLSTDPDGAGVGLEDLDGDGQFDDLAPGQSITITVYEHWADNSANCPVQTYDNFNSHNLSYSDMCGNYFTTNPLPANGAYRVQSIAPSYVFPAQVTHNNPFTAQICMNFGSFSQPSIRPVDSLYLDVVLPPGISLYNGGSVKFNGTDIASANGYATLIDSLGYQTLRIARKGNRANYCYSIDFVYNCTAGQSSLNFGIRNYYIGDSCDASRENYICTNKVVTPRCPDPCPDGMINFQPAARRVNLGYTNQTLSTKVDPASVTGTARVSGLPLDTFEIIVPGRQFAALGFYENLYYHLQLGRASGQDVFQFAGGTFNQVTTSGTVSSAMSAPVSSASTTTLQHLNWNLTSNLDGGRISSGDSVWLNLKFTVTRANSDALYGAVLQQVPSISSSLTNINALNVHVGCDTAWAFDMLVSGINGAGNYLPAVTINNCNSANTSSNEYIGARNASDIFPNEFRPQARIDSVVITLPSGYSLFPTTNTFNASYWNTLSTNTTNTPSSTAGIMTQVSETKWVITNPRLASGGWKYADFGSSMVPFYSLNYAIAPTCAAVTGTQPYSITWYYTDFLYADTLSGIKKSNSASSTITYNAIIKPAINLQNNTGEVIGVLPQHYWDVKINSTGTGTAAYVWMALDRTGSGITVDSIVYDGNNITASAETFGSQKEWYKLTAAGIPSSQTKIARIYFKYNHCTSDSIKVSSGWNCTSYPTSPDGYVCTASSMNLKIVPAGSQIQLAITRQPGNGGTIDMCSTDSIMVVANSAEAANVISPYLLMYPPAGFHIPSSLMVEYPLNSGNWQSIATVPYGGGGVRLNLDQHTGIGANGLPGTITSAAAEARQVRIKIPYSSDCSFTSGTRIDFQIFGHNPCGTESVGNGSEVKSSPINITNVVSDGVMGMSQGISSNILGCTTTALITVTNTPVYRASQNLDTAVYILPSGLLYSGNFTRGTNCSSCTVSTEPGLAGTTLVKIALPGGVAVGRAIVASFRVTPTSWTCGDMTITGSTKRMAPPVTCGVINCTSPSTIIGTVSPLNLSIRKPNLDITHINFLGPSWMPGGTANIKVALRNTGLALALSNTYIVEFFCGSSTTPFDSHVITKGIGIGMTEYEDIAITIPTAPTCNSGESVYIRIQRTTNNLIEQCLCNPSQSYMMPFGVLPANLTAFDVKKQSATSLVKWTVENGSTKDYFEVQRSADGKDFTTIETVLRKESEAEVKQFSVTDRAPFAGENYYRIKIVDKTGKATYSPAKRVVFGEGSELQAFPNPVQHTLSVLVDDPSAIKEMSILDVVGHVVVQLPKYQSNISMGHLANGTYILRVVYKDGSVSIRKIEKKK